ncbi:unnamed protein product, partial [Aureobasidium vineae]
LNSTVWSCRRKTTGESAQSVNKSRVVVVKVLCRDRAEVERNWRKTAKELTLEEYTEEVSAYEAKIMESLNHKHIVRFIDCHDGGTTSNMLIMNICMEKLDCDLKSFVEDNSGTITKTEFAKMAQQICLALQYLHKQKLIHGDLKPQNILVDKSNNNMLKLGDFGSTVELGSEERYVSADNFGGTPFFVAPELLKDEAKCGRAVDFWGVGCVLAFMAITHNPFQFSAGRLIMDHEILANYRESEARSDDRPRIIQILGILATLGW